MKKIVIALAVLTLAASSYAATVNIAQIYSGGGSSNPEAMYMKDYVVLFNNTGFDIDISNWALEYGSATGNWGSSTGNYFVFPEGTWIGGCSYLFVACGSAGTGGADFPVAPDFITTNMSMGAANGKMGLFTEVNANTPCGSELPGTLVDKVSWGTANCAEGTAVAALSISTGADRNNQGQTDTDDNSMDFTVVTAPVPFNSQVPAIPCAAVSTENAHWGTIKALFR